MKGVCYYRAMSPVSSCILKPRRIQMPFKDSNPPIGFSLQIYTNLKNVPGKKNLKLDNYQKIYIPANINSHLFHDIFVFVYKNHTDVVFLQLISRNNLLPAWTVHFQAMLQGEKIQINIIKKKIPSLKTVTFNDLFSIFQLGM